MARQLQRQDSDFEFQSNHPGCLWRSRLFHFLDYYHWHNIKMMLPRRKHGTRRHAKRNVSQQRASVDCCAIEEPDYLTDNAEPLLAEEYSSNVVKDRKKSGRAQIKLLIAKEMTHEESPKQWKLDLSSAQFPLQDTEPPDYCLDNAKIKGMNPDAFTDYGAGNSRQLCTSSQQKVSDEGALGDDMGTMNSGEHSRIKLVAKMGEPFSEKNVEKKEASGNPKDVQEKQLNGDSLKENDSIIGIYNVNKKLFLEMLRGPNVGTDNSYSLSHSRTRVRLSKCKSYPSVDSTQHGYGRSSSLKHKQNEFFPKVETTIPSTQVSNSVAPESQTKHPKKSTSDESDVSVSSETRGETSISSLDSSLELKRLGWNQLVVYNFNIIRGKIKQAFKDGKRGNKAKPLEASSPVFALGHELPHDNGETNENMKIDSSQDFMNITRSWHSGSQDDSSKNGNQRVTRTSINESLERYTRLFESSFNREAKCKRSGSLKLLSENKVPKAGNAPRSLGRNLSLPDGLVFFRSLFDDSSCDILGFKKLNRTVGQNTTAAVYSNVNSASAPVSAGGIISADTLETILLKNLVLERNSKESTKNLEGSPVSENNNGVAEAGEGGDVIAELMNTESSQSNELNFGCELNAGGDPAEACRTSEPETCSLDYITCSPGFALSQDSDPSYGCALPIEMGTSADQSENSNSDALPAFCMRSESDGRDDAEFNFVRYVLELSGLTEESFGTWRSVDQPLTSLFEHSGTVFPSELECCGKEVGSHSDHKLLFDLVHETILAIHKRSPSYFPKAFSFDRPTHWIPTGKRLLEDVWARVSWYLELEAELDRSLDDVVARDFMKGDAWMSLNCEAEFIAMELEDSIMDELLDEIINF